MEEVLKVFLEEFGQDHLKDRLAYCMKELAVNAKKQIPNECISKKKISTLTTKKTTKSE